MTLEARIRLWERALIGAPLAAVVVTPLVARLLGGFSEPLVGVDVSPVTAIGILGTLCFPVAAYYFAQMKHNEALAERSRSWPTVPGTIESSALEQRIVGNGREQHMLSVSYTYVVGGRTFRGTNLAFAPQWLEDKALAEQLARKYPAQAAVTVHVDPADPEIAVLETSTALVNQKKFLMWVLVGFPVFGAVVAAFRSLG